MSNLPFPTQLAVGMLAYVLHEPGSPNRVRSTPNGAIIGRLHPGTVMKILEGPAVDGPYIWWKIDSPVANLTGWTAEGTPGQYYLSPIRSQSYCPGLLPGRLQVGDRVMVTDDPNEPNVIRTEPSKSSDLIGRLQPGEEAIIIGDVQCDLAHHIQYWQIALSPDFVGWTGECDGANYWLEPVIVNRNGRQMGYYYQVQPSESWSVIAHALDGGLEGGMTVAQLQALNPELVRPGDVLHVGDRLWIPFNYGS